MAKSNTGLSYTPPEHSDRNDCEACYGSSYPYPHEGCDGWIHEDFIDESYDSVYTTKFCSGCDEEFE